MPSETQSDTESDSQLSVTEEPQRNTVVRGRGRGDGRGGRRGQGRAGCRGQGRAGRGRAGGREMAGGRGRVGVEEWLVAGVK